MIELHQITARSDMDVKGGSNRVFDLYFVTNSVHL